MALGLPEDLWKGGAIRPLRSARKVADMVRLNIPLDPGKTGREAVSLENSLRRMIVGQDEAIQQIVNIYQMNLTGMSAPGRPIGNFLFLGPTGSGKTRIVEATAEALLKNPRAVMYGQPLDEAKYDASRCWMDHQYSAGSGGAKSTRSILAA